MKGRKAVVLDDEETIRSLLCKLLSRRGYEVTSFSNPSSRECPRQGDGPCPQPKDQPCADVILTDLEMPTRSGLSYVEDQLQHGCKCPHIALISGSASEADFDRARQLGVKTFTKPLHIKEFENWLDGVENSQP